MAHPDVRGLIHIGRHVLRTTISTASKRVYAILGNVIHGKTHVENAEWIQHVGFVSLPPEAEAKKNAATTVTVEQGNHTAVIASQDARGLELAGQLSPGETCLYGSGTDGKAQGRVLIKKDGSVNIFTKEGNTSGGAGLGIFVNADGSISIASSKGNAVLLESDGGVKVFNASGSIQIKSSGHIKITGGSKVEISAGAITLGGLAALPLAVGPQVVAAITALQTQLTVQAAAWAALGALTGPVVGAMIAPIAAPVAGATVAGTLAVTLASPLIPTKRVSGD